jgi:30S ribosomal protein S31
MGRGDKRTKRGKISKGTFGRLRPAKVKKSATPQEKKD